MNRLEILLYAVLDHVDLSPAEELELEELLSFPEHRRQAIFLIETEVQLRAGEPMDGVEESVIELLRTARDAEADALVDPVIHEISTAPVMRWRPRPARDRGPFLLGFGLAAAVAVSVFLAISKTTSPAKRPAPLLETAELGGHYRSVVVHREGRETPLVSGVALQSGDRIEVNGDGNASFLADGGKTRMALEPNTGLVIAGTSKAPKYELHRGAVSMELAPRTGAPLQIVTSSAFATVRGTRFRLAATSVGEWLSVTEGKVEFSRPGEPNHQILVLAGQFALIAPGVELRSYPLPADGVPSIPLPINHQYAEVFGDADWAINPPIIRQRKVSRLPPFASEKGFNSSALSAYTVSIPPTPGVLVEARVRIDAALDQADPAAQGGYALGLRLISPKDEFRLKSSQGSDVHVLAIGLSNKKHAHLVAEPRVIEFTHPPLGEWRMKFIATRLDGEKTRLRGKFWPVDGPEPVAWQLDTTGPATENFHKISLESTRLAVTWSELGAFRVE